jgi:hypothetical protein
MSVAKRVADEMDGKYMVTLDSRFVVLIGIHFQYNSAVKSVTRSVSKT